jgi:hypothetical protein
MAKLTAEQLEPYSKAIAARICSFCNDRDMHGHCARPADDPCALHAHLDLVVESILGVGDAPEVEPYLAALRAKTCPHCRQDEAGACALRDLGQCAPDAYLLPVIEVIEDVAKEHGHGKWAGAGAEPAASKAPK